MDALDLTVCACGYECADQEEFKVHCLGCVANEEIQKGITVSIAGAAYSYEDPAIVLDLYADHSAMVQFLRDEFRMKVRTHNLKRRNITSL